MALTEAAKEGKWLMMICSELGFNFKSYKLYCDAQSAICLAKNAVHHERTKHVVNKIHFIRDIVDFGLVKIHKIHTTLNLADMLTKGLPGNAFEKYLETLGSLPDQCRTYFEMVLLFKPSHQRSTYIHREKKS